MLPLKSMTLPLVVVVVDDDDDDDDELACVAVVCLPQAKKRTEELNSMINDDFNFIEHLVE
jgi:hypothetical protein